MTRFYVNLIVRAIMNFPGSHGYSIIKNLLALPIKHTEIFLPDVNGRSAKRESINIGQKNRGVLKRPAKSFIECLTK